MRHPEGLAVEASATEVYHHQVGRAAADAASYLWEVAETIPFDELIISWNAMRPQFGGYAIEVSLRIGEIWTPYYLYAKWGASGQSGGDAGSEDFHLKICQDIVELSRGTLSSGFRIRVAKDAGANLEEFYTIQACVSRLGDFHPDKTFSAKASLDLHVPLISQFALSHKRKGDMCSPASTSAVVSYLMGINRIDPIAFAMHARDEAFDIFGNWVLNTAHASSILGKGWNCWVQRLNGFGPIYDRLKKDTPVVVSVKGQLRGAPFDYPNGHLIVVKGFKPEKGVVVCMDPAFPNDQSSEAEYLLSDFMEAWSRRRCIAYLFETAILS